MRLTWLHRPVRSALLQRLLCGVDGGARRARPVERQVEGDAAGSSGDPGGHDDQVAAQVPVRAVA